MLRVVAFVRSGEHPGRTDALSQRGEQQIEELAPKLVEAFRLAGVSEPCVVYTLASGTLHMGREETAYILAGYFSLPHGDVRFVDSEGADELTAELGKIYAEVGNRSGLIVVTSSEHTMALIQRFALERGLVWSIPELPPGRAHIVYPEGTTHVFLFLRSGRGAAGYEEL